MKRRDVPTELQHLRDKVWFDDGYTRYLQTVDGKELSFIEAGYDGDVFGWVFDGSRHLGCYYCTGPAYRGGGGSIGADEIVTEVRCSDDFTGPTVYKFSQLDIGQAVGHYIDLEGAVTREWAARRLLAENDVAIKQYLHLTVTQSGIPRMDWFMAKNVYAAVDALNDTFGLSEVSTPAQCKHELQHYYCLNGKLPDETTMGEVQMWNNVEDEDYSGDVLFEIRADGSCRAYGLVNATLAPNQTWVADDTDGFPVFAGTVLENKK